MPLSVFVAVTFIVEFFIYLFHLSMLILMISKQNTSFKGPFFNIFRILLINEMILYFFTIITQKLFFIPLLLEFFKSSILFVTVSYNVITLIAILQFFGHFLLALNRFTLIWLPLKHENVWRKQWYTVLLLIALPFLIMSWRLHEPLHQIQLPDGGFYVTFINRGVAELNQTVSVITYFTTTCLAGIFNFLAFLKFLFRKQNNSALNVNEKNLLLVSLVIFLAQLLRISFNIGNLIFSTNPAILAFLTSIVQYLIDVYIWSGSISLMFLSSSTRKAYKQFYFKKFKVHKIDPVNSIVSKTAFQNTKF